MKLATIWLDGCSGCHMSLLDLDTALIPIARKVDMVYGPLVDAQEFPEDVDVTLIEGAVSTQEDVQKVQKIRQRSRLVVSLGDCAVTGNVAALRNHDPRPTAAAEDFTGGADHGQVCSQRRPAATGEAVTSGARLREGRCTPSPAARRRAR